MFPSPAHWVLAAILLLTHLTAGFPTYTERHDYTYVALGASDAVGVGATRPETEGWVPRLHATMPRGTQMINLGVPSSTTREARRHQLPVALAARPDVVTVWLGVNDLNGGVSLAAYTRDLDLMLRKLRATGAVVAVGNIPDLTRLPAMSRLLRVVGAPGTAAIRAEIDRWNSEIARIARENDAILVDVDARSRQFANRRALLSADGFHPSSRGYARLAALWRQRLGSAGVEALESRAVPRR